MKITWRDKITVIVGEMDRASALDCYKALGSLAELPDGEALTVRALTDFCIRLAVERAPVVVTYAGNVYREGTIEVTGDDFTPFTISLPLKGAALDHVPHTLAEAWQMAAVEENAFLEDWLKKVVGPLTTQTATNEATSDSGPSKQSGAAENLPMTTTIGA